jgi:SH3-like domain-containing protein
MRSLTKSLLIGLGMLVALVLAAGAAYARSKTVYVTVNSAKLREGPEAGQSKAVCYVPYGEPLEVLDENENFYKAKWGEKVGWVHKSQVGEKRPREEDMRKSRAGLTQMTGSQASAAAAQRGLFDGTQGRAYADAKGLQNEYKMVQWMETLAPSQEALDRFMEEGKLGPYREEK